MLTGGLTKKSRADGGMVKGRKKMKEKVDRILNGDIEELTELAEELESRRKFKAGDSVYYIRQDEEIHHIVFSLNNAYHYGLVMSGNAFKTLEEAEAHKDEVLAKYQELRDRGLI